MKEKSERKVFWGRKTNTFFFLGNRLPYFLHTQKVICDGDRDKHVKACLAVVLVLSDFANYDRLTLQRVAVKSTVDVEIKVPSDGIQSCYRFSL